MPRDRNVSGCRRSALREIYVQDMYRFKTLSVYVIRVNHSGRVRELENPGIGEDRASTALSAPLIPISRN